MADAISVELGEDQDADRARLEAKLRPDRIRATLAFSGLYQLTHQLIQNAVLEQVKVFFGKSVLDDTWLHGKVEYDREVRDLDKNLFKASLLWLQKMDAVTAEQCDRLDAIYRHRHDLAHDIGKYLIDVEFEPNMDLFLDALSILRDIHRFWTEVEAGLGTFDDYEDLDLDDVTPAALAMLGLCIQAYFDLLPVAEDSGAAEATDASPIPPT